MCNRNCFTACKYVTRHNIYELNVQTLLCVLARQASTFSSVDALSSNGNGSGASSAPDGNTVSGPLQLYQHRLAIGELRPDENQLHVVEHLQKLSEDLDGYKHQPRSTDGMFTEMSAVCSIYFLCL